MHLRIALASFALLALPLSELRAEPEATAKAAPEASASAGLEPVLKKLQELDAQLADITRRLDSISKFLGDRQASTFDTVDRRLRDMERSIDDLKREVERMR